MKEVIKLSTANSVKVGIEAISVYLPGYSLDLAEIAREYNIDPQKYYKGLGLKKMTVPHPNDDTVTMAANAAMSLFEKNDIDRRDVGMVLVSTETGIDASKPVAVYVHELVGLPSNCRTLDIQHGCYGSTAALKLAAAWATGAARGSKALVIASDIANYQEGSPGEPTQGAAAVAMLVGMNPAILELLSYPEVVYSSQVMDFWRPNYSRAAFVDSRLSIDCYLDCLKRTFKTFQSNSGISIRDYDNFLFHMPFPRMAEKAYQSLVDEFGPVDERERRLFVSEGLERQVLPSTWAARESGNSYNGSLYISLAALLEGQNAACENRLIGMYSYGSGHCAEFFAAKTGSDSGAWEGRIGLKEMLSNRIEIDYHTYLQFRKESEERNVNDCFCEMPQHLSESEAVFLGINNHKRIYIPARNSIAAEKMGNSIRVPSALSHSKHFR
jgi:hydroxymethylglutaryl-CoA synthase